MSNCRSGCREQNHDSYAECLQSANVRTAATINSNMSIAWDTTKKELAAYKTARANGIQPAGTSMQKIREAERASQALGRPYDGDTMPPANLIVNKNTAKFVNTED
jgi:hypothetical protein